MLSLYGFGVGGVLPLQATVWASYFGRQHLGQIRSVAMPFSIIFGAGGPLLAGALYDRTGNYTSAFAAFQVLGLLLLLFARPPRRRAEPGAGDLTPQGGLYNLETRLPPT